MEAKNNINLPRFIQVKTEQTVQYFFIFGTNLFVLLAYSSCRDLTTLKWSHGTVPHLVLELCLLKLVGSSEMELLYKP
jgi:hypothetical protein